MSDPEKNAPPKLPGESPVYSERPFAVDGQQDMPLVFRESDAKFEWIVVTPDPEKILALAKHVSMTVLETKRIELAKAPQRIEHPPATRYISY